MDEEEIYRSIRYSKTITRKVTKLDFLMANRGMDYARSWVRALKQFESPDEFPPTLLTFANIPDEYENEDGETYEDRFPYGFEAIWADRQPNGPRRVKTLWRASGRKTMQTIDKDLVEPILSGRSEEDLSQCYPLFYFPSTDSESGSGSGSLGFSPYPCLCPYFTYDFSMDTSTSSSETEEPANASKNAPSTSVSDPVIYDLDDYSSEFGEERRASFP